MKKRYYVYIITNARKTVLYTGVTGNLPRRLTQHYEARGKSTSFAGRYFCYHLLYYEQFNRPMDAIKREKQLKGITAKKKRDLISESNPSFAFLNFD